MKQLGSVVGAIPQRLYSWVAIYFIKHKNDMHAPAASQKL